jgi:pimeloyl-ACP methyl ester carboxylesterase
MNQKLISAFITCALLAGYGAAPVSRAIAAPSAATVSLHAPQSHSAAATAQFGAEWKSEPCETFKLNKDVAESADCGYVTVPALHDEPDGDTIELAVVRIRSIADKPAADPLFMEQGGPGGSTISYFPSPTLLPKLLEILKTRDIVLVEQRGTQYSKPHLECPESYDYAVVLAKGETEANDAYLQACKERWEETANLSAFNIKQNAEDIYLVAEALGYGQFNYYGVSFGTLLGQYVLNQSADHPGMLRSVVLDSVVPIDINDDVIKDQTASNAIRAFFAACAQDAVCDKDFPRLEQRVMSFADELNVEPEVITLTLQSGDTITTTFKGTDLTRLIFDSLYAIPNIQALPNNLDHLVRTRDFSWVEKHKSDELAPGGVAEGMHLGMKCPRRSTFPAYAQDLFEPAYPQVDIAAGENQSYDRRCAILDVEAAGADEFAIRVTDIPTLILSGSMDPATPPQFGEHIAKKLDTAYAFTLPDVGHNVMLGSKTTCPASIAAAFLNNPTQSPNGDCITALKPDFYGRIIPLDELKLTERDLGNGIYAPIPSNWVAQNDIYSDPNDPLNWSTGAVIFTIEEAASSIEAIQRFDSNANIILRDRTRGNYAWTVAESSRLPSRETIVAAAPLPDGKRVVSMKLLTPPDNPIPVIDALLRPLLSGVKVTAFGEAWQFTPCDTFHLSKELTEITDCGYVTVPLKHGAATTETIQLAVARIRSIAEKPAADPLFMEQGGPGGSTIGFFPTRLAELSELLKQRDVVLVEQRGTQYSKPYLECADRYAYSVAVAKGEAKDDDSYLNACVGRWANETDLSAFNNRESAADIYSVAEALGYPTFNYYGVSYGTLLGQHVMKLAKDNPGKLRSIILDGVQPIDVKDDELKDQTASNAMKWFFLACADDAACNRDFPDLQARFLSFLDELNANPRDITVTLKTGEALTATITGADVSEMVFSTLYSHMSMRFLPSILDTMIRKGDLSWVAEQRANQLAPGGLPEGMHLAMKCPRITVEHTNPLLTLEPAFPQVNFNAKESASYARRCAMMNVPSATADDFTPTEEDIPTLVLNGRFDPTTPAQFGDHAASTLKTAYAYTFVDVGHGALPSSPTTCPISIANQFLSDPTTMPDASCAKDLKPIFAPRVTPLDEMTFAPRAVITGNMTVTASIPTVFDDAAGAGVWSDPADPINQPTGFVAFRIFEADSVDFGLRFFRDPVVIAESQAYGDLDWKIMQSATNEPGWVHRGAFAMLPDGKHLLKVTFGGTAARADVIFKEYVEPVLSSIEVK